MESVTKTEGDVAAPGPIASGALQSNRIIPCEPAPGLSGSVAGETTVIIHEMEGGEKLKEVSSYLRSSGIVYRAMQMLAEWKYRPARISCSSIPVDVIALRDTDAFLIQVISSKRPVPDAATLSAAYRDKIQNLRLMGTNRHFRKIVMVYSSKFGWKYYEVLPGGLIPAWDLSKSAEK